MNAASAVTPCRISQLWLSWSQQRLQRVWGVDGRQLCAWHLGKEGGETRVGPHDDAESGGGCAGVGVLPPVGDGRQNGRPAEAGGGTRDGAPEGAADISDNIFHTPDKTHPNRPSFYCLEIRRR